MNTPPKPWSHPVGKMACRYARFCIVGATGTAVDMGILFLLTSPRFMDWNVSGSKVIAAEAAVFNNFVWNHWWTFRPPDGVLRTQKKMLSRFARFNLVCAAGIGWSVLLLNIQVHWLKMDVYLANFLAIVLASLWNFLFSIRFGWSDVGVGGPNKTDAYFQ
jgi:dolichol-phosphate mannosyltransferase